MQILALASFGQNIKGGCRLATNDEGSNVFLLNEMHGDFIQHRVSINVASRDADNMPSMCRALGCRVSQDRRQVTVFIPRDHSRKLLDDISTSGVIAVVFSRPSTHETIQLKGSDATVTTLETGDTAIIAKFIQNFVQELSAIGHPSELASAILSSANNESLAVTFSPSVAFVQTPGPAAGNRLQG